MTDTAKTDTASFTARIDETSGNKIITIERNDETYDFIVGSGPEGTDIWQRVPYDADDYGQAILLVEGDVPEELHDKARLAASNCPEYAITITDNG